MIDNSRSLGEDPFGIAMAIRADIMVCIIREALDDFIILPALGASIFIKRHSYSPS